MKISPTLFTAILLVSLNIVFAQITDDQKEEKQAKLRSEAIELLRETMSEVANMRTAENRIGFSSELASLMWYHDEREARNMIGRSISDFRTILSGLDTQMNTFGGKNIESFGAANPGATTQMMRKSRVAIEVRQQIASSIAEHDPEMAFDFLSTTFGSVSNPMLRAQIEESSKHFEQQLIEQIAANDPEYAIKFAIRSLEAGLNYRHIELLKILHQKNPDKGVEFATKMLTKLRSGDKGQWNDYVAISLVEFGKTSIEDSKKEGGKTPVLSEQDLKELGEMLAQQILADGEVFEYWNALRVAKAIESFLPGRAAQIRAKHREHEKENNAGTINEADVASIRDGQDGSDQGIAEAAREQMEREKAEGKLVEDLMTLGNKELPKDERDRVIAEARQILMQSSSPDRKIMGLNLLAAGAARFGDKVLAVEIMRDAESLVALYPKNHKDFLHTWMLISGYAEVDPDKAFVILDGTIYRANEVIAAFIKVGEFIDDNEEMIVDGEAQVGIFAGGAIRSLSRNMQIATRTLEILVVQDFNRMRGIANRFERTEARVLAKMLLLRSIFGNGPAKTSEDEEIEKFLKEN